MLGGFFAKKKLNKLMNEAALLDARPPSLLQALEPRMMYDGAAVATVNEVVDLSDGANAEEQNYILNALHENENVVAAQSLFDVLQLEGDMQTDYSQFKEVVIIDVRAQDIQTLIAGITQDSAVEIIDMDEKGVEAIATLLQKYNDLDAIHLVSDNNETGFLFGVDHINNETLNQYHNQIAQWGNALSNTGKLFFVSQNEVNNELQQEVADVVEANRGLPEIELVAELTMAEQGLLDHALETAQQSLKTFALRSDFDDIISTAFGDTYSQEKLEQLKAQWLAGDFSDFPDIQIVERGLFLGAYERATDTIYLSQGILSNGAVMQHVLLEEFGHAIDARINILDSVGDEGAVFSSIVIGAAISNAEMAKLRKENDRIDALLLGNKIHLELATGGSVDDTIGAHPTTPSEIDVLANDPNVHNYINNAGFSISVVVGQEPANGAVVYDATKNVLVYTPGANFAANGDAFGYEWSDNFSNAGSAQVTLVPNVAPSEVSIGMGISAAINALGSNHVASAVADFNNDGNIDFLGVDTSGGGDTKVFFGDGIWTSGVASITGTSSLPNIGTSISFAEAGDIYTIHLKTPIPYYPLI